MVASLADQTRDHYAIPDTGRNLEGKLTSKLDGGGYTDRGPDEGAPEKALEVALRLAASATC